MPLIVIFAQANRASSRTAIPITAKHGRNITKNRVSETGLLEIKETLVAEFTLIRWLASPSPAIISFQSSAIPSGPSSWWWCMVVLPLEAVVVPAAGPQEGCSCWASVHSRARVRAGEALHTARIDADKTKPRKLKLGGQKGRNALHTGVWTVVALPSSAPLRGVWCQLLDLHLAAWALSYQTADLCLSPSLFSRSCCQRCFSGELPAGLHDGLGRVLQTAGCLLRADTRAGSGPQPGVYSPSAVPLGELGVLALPGCGESFGVMQWSTEMFCGWRSQKLLSATIVLSQHQPDLPAQGGFVGRSGRLLVYFP